MALANKWEQSFKSFKYQTLVILYDNLNEYNLTDEKLLFVGLLNKLTTLKTPSHFHWKIEHE